MTRVEQIIQDLREAGTSPSTAFTAARKDGSHQYIGGGTVSAEELKAIIEAMAPRGGVVLSEDEKARQRIMRAHDAARRAAG